MLLKRRLPGVLGWPEGQYFCESMTCTKTKERMMNQTIQSTDTSPHVPEENGTFCVVIVINKSKGFSDPFWQVQVLQQH